MNEEKKFAEMFHTTGPYLTLGLQLAITVIVFFFIGKYADDYFGTKPWLMITGALFGSVGALLKFVRTVKELSDANE